MSALQEERYFLPGYFAVTTPAPPDAGYAMLGRSCGGNTAGQPSDDGCYTRGSTAFFCLPRVRHGADELLSPMLGGDAVGAFERVREMESRTETELRGDGVERGVA